MRAFALTKYGSPLRGVDMPEPVLREREVLVRVAAAGINHGDERLRAGEFKLVFPFTLPMVIGSEFAGDVVATGPGVTRFDVGAQVFAYADLARMGAFAEYVAIDEAYLAPAPESLSLTEAAALPVAGLTAWQALVELGGLKAGQTVLIHGGSGGVGSVAIQLAKHLGAVVATTASAANAQLVRDLGADVVIDYRSEDFADLVSDVDVVLDTQGGDTLTRSLDVVRPGGIVVGVTGPPDPQFAAQQGVNPVVATAIRGLSGKVRRHARRRGVTYRFLFIRPDGGHLAEIAGLADRGVLRPLVDRVLPFAQTPQALDSVIGGGARGKVLVSTDPATVDETGWPAATSAPDSWPADLASTASDSRPAGPAGTSAPDATSDSARHIAVIDLASTWATAPTQTLSAGSQTLAYRELGVRGGTPVLLLTHLGATLDNWDPRVVDALAAGHHVVAVDLPGVGGSSGSVPRTVQGMADAAVRFVEAMGFDRVDVVSFSLGGFVAQQVALDRPDLVRRLVLTGTGPAGGEGIDRPTGPAYVYWDMVRGAAARTDAKEFLFFDRDATGRAAAEEYLARLDERVMDRDRPIASTAFRTQLTAIQAWGRAPAQDLSRITAPTLIANGDHDRMVPTELSRDLHRRIPGSALVIYPNSGHGGVFQYWEQFTRALLEHLDG